MKEKSRHKGVTLFELLIVIAVIVILSTATFLASTKMADTADAVRIIADMTAIRNAVVSWHTDNRETFRSINKNKKTIQKNDDEMRGYRADICTYLEQGTSFNLNANNGGIKEGGYGLFNTTGYRTTWYVGYRFLPDEEDIKPKIAGRAKELELHFTNSESPNPTGTNNGTNDSNIGNKIVWMRVLGDLDATSSWWN